MSKMYSFDDERYQRRKKEEVEDLLRTNNDEITSASIAGYEEVSTFDENQSTFNVRLANAKPSQPQSRLSNSESTGNLQKPQLPPRPPFSFAQLEQLKQSHVIVEKPPLPARPSRIPFSLQNQSSSLSRFTSNDRNFVYLDYLNSNRLPPYSSSYVHDFQTSSGTSKIAITCIAMSRNFVVTGGVGQVKIWNLFDGNCVNVLSAKSGETKATAVAFLPSSSPDLDGKFFWIGFSDGDLWMINVDSGEILERRVSAHNHSIVEILRYRTSVLSFDENGLLQIWMDFLPFQNPIFGSNMKAEASSHLGRVVSLESKPKTMRIGSQIELAHFVKDVLWCLKSRSIEIACPFGISTNSKKIIDIPATVGSITCITSIICDYNEIKVFTGHDDGKLVEWDGLELSKRRIIDTGPYKITAMIASFDNTLWLSMKTGRNCVVDISKFMEVRDDCSVESLPVTKEWNCETSDYIENVLINQESLVFINEMNVIGLSKAGLIHVWDALCPKDLILTEIRKQESRFCNFKNVKLLICSWNIDASKPDHLLQRVEDTYFIDKWVTTIPEGADIIVFGLQEIIDLESKSIAAKGIWKKTTTQQQQQADHSSRTHAWKNRLSKALKDNFKHQYELIEFRNMVGILACVFVKECLVPRITNCESFSIETGMGGAYGNKGAVIIRFLTETSSFCFIVSHLPAHQNNIGKRNADAIKIVKSGGFSPINSGLTNLVFSRGGDGAYILDHENIFFFGDLNYRIDLEYSKCMRCIAENDVQALLMEDQLIKQRNNLNSTTLLRLFNEPQITFLPTYKFDQGTDTYDTSEKKRVPAYCDRILFRDSCSETSPTSRITPLDYKRFDCKVSDHKPIAAAFNISIKCLKNQRELEIVETVVNKEADSRRNQYGWNSKIKWLECRFNVDRKVLETLLKQDEGDISTVVNILKARGITE